MYLINSHDQQNVVHVAGSGHVNVWEWISCDGHGWHALHIWVVQCCQLSWHIELFLPPSFTTRNHIFPPGAVAFVHNPVHQASTVQECFQEHPQFQLLPWPKKWAYCHPVKNIGFDGDNIRASAGAHIPRTFRSRSGYVEGKLDFVTRHTGNLRRQLQTVIDKSGGWIAYWSKKFLRIGLGVHITTATCLLLNIYVFYLKYYDYFGSFRSWKLVPMQSSAETVCHNH